MAWAVPALSTPATLPDSSTVVANPTISRFMMVPSVVASNPVTQILLPTP